MTSDTITAGGGFSGTGFGGSSVGGALGTTAGGACGPGGFTATDTTNCVNVWPNYTPGINYTPYYPYYVTVPDAVLAARVAALEIERAELRGKVDTLEKMLAALIGGKTNA